VKVKILRSVFVQDYLVEKEVCMRGGTAQKSGVKL